MITYHLFQVVSLPAERIGLSSLLRVGFMGRASITGCAVRDRIFLLLTNYLLLTVSIYKFKQVSLADNSYHNINAAAKAGRTNRHSITLQIDSDHAEVFADLCGEILEGVEKAKAELGWADDAEVRLPFDLEAETLQVAWNDKRHNEKLRVWIKEEGIDEAVQLQPSEGQLPNLSDGSVVSVGLYVRVSTSAATEKYAEKIWINVEPEILLIHEVKMFKPNTKEAYNLQLDELEQDLLSDF